tara:strand:- start:1921 stop:3117 length:1197 start_codon:yes stop_codon:yes gene_type:complete
MPEYDPPFIASSDQPTSLLWTSRVYYQTQASKIFNEIAPGAPNYIDMWRNSTLYGKMSPEGFLILPQEKFMNYALGANKASALPWVYDGIMDLQAHLNRAIAHGRTALNEIFGGFEIVQGYESPYRKYIDHALRILAAFNKILGARTKKIITSFPEYVQEFAAFLERGDTPFTFASYYSSHRASAFSTGLVMSFGNINANNDFYKNRYFEDPEFGKYVQAAANFGFRVDLNAPWRVVADLKSSPMAKYMLQHNIPNFESAFARFYTAAVEYELVSLITLLVLAYERYQERRQYGVSQSYCIKTSTRFKHMQTTEVVKAISRMIFIEEYSIDRFFAEYGASQIFSLWDSVKRAEKKNLDIATYRAFKRRFTKAVKAQQFATAALSLTRFYNGILPNSQR